MSISNNENPSCPNLISSHLTPKIYWHQSDNAIFIKIPLVDVEKYYLKVEPHFFQFSTNLHGRKYFLGIKLCGTVIAEKTSHEKHGREVKICLIKAHKWTDWPRLQLSREKSSFITVDPDHIFKKSWDDPSARLTERESFEEYKKRNNITNIQPAGSSSSSQSGSDDERLVGYD